jgi:hypothetical protein
MTDPTHVVAQDIWQQVYDMIDDIYPTIGEEMHKYLRDTGCPDETTAVMTKTLALLSIVCLMNQPILHQNHKKTFYTVKDEDGKLVPDERVEVDMDPLTKSFWTAKNIACGFLFSVKTEGVA